VNDLEEKDPDLGETVEDRNLERNLEVKDLEVKGLDQGLVRGRNPRRIEKERRKGSRPKKSWYYFDAILHYDELFLSLVVSTSRQIEIEIENVLSVETNF
jgi:hypothetical protein